MSHLFLNSSQQSDLFKALAVTTEKFGKPVFDGTICSYACDRWDCFISCSCANSRN